MDEISRLRLPESYEINPLFSNQLSEKTRLLLTRIIIICIGFYIWYWGLLYEGTDDIWDYMAITGAVYFTGAIAVILFGIYWEKASSAGAIAALLGGLSALVGLEPIRESIPMISGLEAEHIGLLTLCFSIALMIIFSLIIPDKKGVVA